MIIFKVLQYSLIKTFLDKHTRVYTSHCQFKFHWCWTVFKRFQWGKLLPKATPGIIDCITHLMRLDDGLCHCRPSKHFKTHTLPTNSVSIHSFHPSRKILEFSSASWSWRFRRNKKKSKSQLAANAANGRRFENCKTFSSSVSVHIFHSFLKNLGAEGSSAIKEPISG